LKTEDIIVAQADVKNDARSSFSNQANAFIFLELKCINIVGFKSGVLIDYDKDNMI
jgi:hypothetical protein